MKGFTKFIMYVLFLILLIIIINISGEVVVNNIPYRIIGFIGGWTIGDKVWNFIEWNFKDTNTPQPNSF